MDMRFEHGMFGISFGQAHSELAKYNLGQVTVQEVRWDEVDSQQSITHFSMAMEMLMIT
jgi:hypothetical protein